jgi:hypothetical protein
VKTRARRRIKGLFQQEISKEGQGVEESGTQGRQKENKESGQIHL